MFYFYFWCEILERWYIEKERDLRLCNGFALNNFDWTEKEGRARQIENGEKRTARKRKWIINKDNKKTENKNKK